MSTSPINGGGNQVFTPIVQSTGDTLAPQRSAANNQGALSGLQPVDNPQGGLQETHVLPETQHMSRLDKLKQFFADRLTTNISYEKREMPTDKASLTKLKEDADLARVPYTGKVPDERLSTPRDKRYDDRLSSVITMNLEDRLEQDSGPGKVENDGVGNFSHIIDKKSGLSAHIVVDKATQDVKIVFGGASSGLEVDEKSSTRTKQNFKTTLSQWVTNVKVALGIKSHSMQQASNLTRHVVDIVKSHPNLQGYSVSTIGHGKGAAEAVYAALSQEEPLNAVGFSSANLGAKLVRDLPQENVARATELVSHYHIKADLLPNLRHLSPTLQPLGQETVIPASGHAGLTSRHENFADHISAFVSSKLDPQNVDLA